MAPILRNYLKVKPVIDYSVFKANECLRKAGKISDLSLILQGRKVLDELYLELLKSPQSLEDEFNDILMEPDNVCFTKRFTYLKFGLREQRKFITSATKVKFLEIVQRTLSQTAKEDFEKFGEDYTNIYKLLQVLAIRGVTDGDLMMVYNYLYNNVKAVGMDGLEFFVAYGNSWKIPTFREAFSLVQEDGESLKFIGQDTRNKWRRIINDYFSEFIQEKLEENIIQSIILKIKEKSWEKKNFDEILKWTESKITTMREMGVALPDLSLVNYQLGLCKEVKERWKS